MRQLRFSPLKRQGSRRKTVRSIRDITLGIGILLLGATAGQAQFSDIYASLTGVHHGAAIWGDYNGDNKLDLLLTGQTTGGPIFSDVFRQDAGWAFTALGAGLDPVAHNQSNRSAWADYDNDGDLDLVITGYSSTGPATRLYNNNGGVFTLVTPEPFQGVFYGSVAWGDYDNDGDLDLFLSGHTNSGLPITTVYRNNGAASGWTFTNMAPAAFVGAGFSDGAWGDYDNDGDLDLIVMGYRLIGTEAHTILYRNDGAGQFLNSGQVFADLGQGNVSWGDYDNDGDLDLAMIGTPNNGSFTRVFKLYRNNGNGTFTDIPVPSIDGHSDGTVAWADCNNDGKLDLLITGNMGFGTPTPHTQVFTGNGAGAFTTIAFSFTGVYDSQASWGDFDNDGRLDVLLAGRTTSSGSIATIYRNTIFGTLPNNAPSSPTGLAAAATSWKSMKLTWNPGTDIETPQAALTYNLHIVDNTSGEVIMPGMANTSTGARSIPAMGNTNQSRAWTIGGLTPGHTYKVYVQTIDNGLKASGFSPALTVTLPMAAPEVMIGDCVADVGAEPNMACGGVAGVYWNSPNIWVRNNPDGLLPGNDYNQRPRTGYTNYVYVRLENISATTLPEGRVHVYFTKASTGLSWPLHWGGFRSGSVMKGDFIGQVDVSNILPGEVRIVGIPWNNIPSDINSFRDHFCMLARLVSGADPMAVDEGTVVLSNTVENHNIAWRNITQFSFVENMADILVRNVSIDGFRTDLGITMPPEDAKLLQYCSVDFQLPHNIFQRWMNDGAMGEGVKVIDAENGVLRIYQPDAFIRGINLERDEEFTGTMKINYPDEWPEWLGDRSFFFDLVQYSQGQQTPIGGETYEITSPYRNHQKRATPGKADLSTMMQTKAHPNPTSTSASILYTLPRETRVTLALYDAAGRLVRTLADASQQSAGQQSATWDGMDADGRPVPSGTYFYQVETEEGTAQGQIRIAR